VCFGRRAVLSSVCWQSGSGKLPHDSCLLRWQAPPGRRSIRQSGNDCGLKHLLERVCTESVLSQRAQGKQWLHTCRQHADRQRDRLLLKVWPCDSQYFYWVDTLETRNLRGWMDTALSLRGAIYKDDVNWLWSIQRQVVSGRPLLHDLCGTHPALIGCWYIIVIGILTCRWIVNWLTSFLFCLDWTTITAYRHSHASLPASCFLMPLI